MAVNAYLVITPYGSGTTGPFGRPLTTDGQVPPTVTKDLANIAIAPSTLIEVSDYGFEIEQTLNFSAPTAGAGAGKVAFDRFTFSKRLDAVSTILYQTHRHDATRYIPGPDGFSTEIVPHLDPEVQPGADFVIRSQRVRHGDLEY